jgi:DNA-directed RNA polymerase subunit N
MIIPVRCFSCGKVIADKWDDFSKRVATGEPTNEVLDDLGVEKYCCRRMLLSHAELVDEILEFHEKKESVDMRGEN